MATTQKPRITAQDLYRFEIVTGVRICPDGKWVVYSQKRVDRKTEKKYSNLWMVPTSVGKPRQFTFGDQTDTLPRWSPDGSQIAFLSNRADKEKLVQIYLISVNGGEAKKLTDIKGEITSLDWSPDGRTLLCTIRKLDPDELERQEDESKKKLGVVSRRYERLFYKFDGYGYLAHERKHLWSVDVASGKAKQLTDHEIFDELYPTYSPDGKWIVFSSIREGDPDRNYERFQLYVMPSKGGKIRKIDGPIGEKHHPAYSSDGKWIAYFGKEGEGEDYKNSCLWVVPADGSEAPRNLTEAYDIEVSYWTIADINEAEPIPPVWSKDGTRLFFQVCIHGTTQLLSIAVDGSDLQKVVAEQGVVASFSFDETQNLLAYFLGKMDDPGQVMMLDVPTGQNRQLTRLNAWLERIDLGKVNEIWYKGPDKNDLQGWVLTPPGFNPKKKYPSILEIHGGPLTQYGYFFMHEFYYLAAHDYVIYFTNPRGGRGYGEKHAKAIFGNWGDKDYVDLMAWTDLVQKEPYIDKERMGVTGGSYGGYMSIWIVGHTNRYKAAVTQRCVSNFISEWGSSDLNWSFETELNNKPPYEDLNYYWDHSPIKYIGNCKTPMLVIHNEGDMRCPIEQGEQVFVALKRLGVDTAFVRFPDEFHGLSRGGRTDRRIVRLDSILEWFEKYLK